MAIPSPEYGGGHVITEGDELPSPPPADSGLVQEVFYPKIYLNGFPKSGLHLSMLMGMCLVEKPAHTQAWAGTFQKNGWSDKWMPDWRIYRHLSRIKANGWLKGHAGYREDIADFIYKMGAAMAFIYRDLRDVAVSMSYHVTSDDDKNFSHQDKDLYKALETHEDVIAACLTGIGDYPGLITRWRQYAPWLDVSWVHPMRYEDMRLKPYKTAKEYITYVYDRTSEANGVKLTMPDETRDKAAMGMVEAMRQTAFSPTFRKGKTGGWKEHFTPRLKHLFRQAGGSEWLIELGYENGYDW